jgi:hypothetical protein
MKRKNHYNEFITLKTLKERLKEDEETDVAKSSTKHDELKD